MTLDGLMGARLEVEVMVDFNDLTRRVDSRINVYIDTFIIYSPALTLGS
jgi:hypothetical protein